MANPTSNFGWQMPTNTDLVKDLPADFETFGQAVDTSMADLKGGTTGQILSKNSNTDMDFVWIANDQGDITSVVAGVGMTGGGTSGAVTLTNDMASTITASGDIVVGTGSGTYDNLPIGTTGQVLTADTTVSPYKVKWAAASAASGPAFAAYRNTSTQSISATTWTKVQLNAEAFDTDSCYDPTTNYRFTPNKSGYYLFSGSIWLSGSTNWNLVIYKNGSDAATFFNTSTIPTLGGGALLYANGSTDYFEAYVYAVGGGTVQNIGGTSNSISGVWIRS